MSERVAIVGSRAHPDLEMVRAYVRTLPAGSAVISGGAPGVDTAATDEAERIYRNGGLLSRLIYRPEDVRTALRVAGGSSRDLLIARNTLIAVACTRMVVFPDGSKGGAWDAVAQAKRFRRPCEIRWADGRVVPA